VCPRADITGISIRSARFVLRKIGVLSESAFRKLDRSWMKYRAEHHLDAFGE